MTRPARWSCRSTPGRPTASTRRGCGTSPSSGWSAAPWWPPVSVASISACGSATPEWTMPWWTDRWPPSTTPPPAQPSGRPHRVPRQLHGLRRPAAGPVSKAGRRLVVAVVYPDLLGTYGDGGNGVVLARRAAWRGIDVDLVQATSDRAAAPGRPVHRGRWGGRTPGAGRHDTARGRHPRRAGGRGGGGARRLRRIPAHRHDVPRPPRSAPAGCRPPRPHHHEGHRAPGRRGAGGHPDLRGAAHGPG